MKAEEQYVGDYAIVMLLRLLVDAQEKNQRGAQAEMAQYPDDETEPGESL